MQFHVTMPEGPSLCVLLQDPEERRKLGEHKFLHPITIPTNAEFLEGSLHEKKNFSGNFLSWEAGKHDCPLEGVRTNSWCLSQPVQL